MFWMGLKYEAAQIADMNSLFCLEDTGCPHRHIRSKLAISVNCGSEASSVRKLLLVIHYFVEL